MTKQLPLIEVAKTRGFASGPFGSNLVSKDYVEDGVPVIRGANMLSSAVVGGEFVYVSQEKYIRDLKSNTALAGDLIFTQRGTLGQVAVVPDSFQGPLVISQSQMRLRIDTTRFDTRFVLAACRTEHFKKQIADRAITGGVPHINLGILKELTIPAMALSRQIAIGEVLGALDDKIAANRRVIAASEDLRTHLWKRACASDRSEVPLSSLARFVNGRAFTKDASGTGRVVIRIAELNSGIGASTVRNDIVVADDHLARPGDLLLAWSGSLTAARWYRDEAIVNQHIFKVIPGENFEMWAVASAVESKVADFQEIAKDKATTMGHIRRSDLDQPVGWPVLSPEEIGVGRSLWSRALSAETENEVLIRARDELLPLLMNGRITVEAAEKTAESVL